MKKLITFLVAIFIGIALSAQLSNTFKYEIKALGGLTIGPTATSAKATITSGVLSGTTVNLYNGATQYSIGVAPADQVAGVAVADTATMLSKYSHKASPTFTGVPLAPTAAAGTNTTQIATTAFAKIASPICFTISFDPWNLAAPTDATDYYYGVSYMSGFATGGGNQQVVIPFDCILIGYSLTTTAQNNATQETSTVYVRINNTTDVQLSNAVTWSATAWISSYFSGGALSTNITAGDKIQIKIHTATWATNPTPITVATVLFFKCR